MTKEEQLNDVLVEIFESLERAIPRMNGRIRRVVARSRLVVADILAKHADSEGRVPLNKISTVTKEIEQQLDGEIYRQIKNELESVLTDVGDATITKIVAAIVSVIGISTLVEAGAIAETVAEFGEEYAEAVLWGLTRSTYRKHTESVVNSAFNRSDGDGKRLNDRLRIIATSLRQEVVTTVRQSIRNRELTSETLRKVKRVFTNSEWRLDTITETESMYTMRQSVAKFAEESGLVKALKIIDIPHGNPLEHHRHRCYIYAHRDEHGLGQGVYPVGTRKIRNPHPRCRAILTFVLADELR
jgi:CHASE3 domain sensor protein